MVQKNRLFIIGLVIFGGNLIASEAAVAKVLQRNSQNRDIINQQLQEARYSAFLAKRNKGIDALKAAIDEADKEQCTPEIAVEIEVARQHSLKSV